ncbi:MAG: DUF881 domain-containing protein [Candidatus Limnocylindria bacterium]
MRTSAGGITVAVVALLLGVLTVSQFRSQDAYSRSLQLETPSSLTTLIASLAERNSALRDEILDLRLRVESARGSVASGQGSLEESERQLAQLRVLAAETAVRGPGITVTVDGQFDERALGDLVNELRNAGAEAIGVNDVRIGPRSYFAAGTPGSLTVDGERVGGPWIVRAVGAPEVIFVAVTRTGGIIGQFELIYRGTRFKVTREAALELPPVRSARR